MASIHWMDEPVGTWELVRAIGPKVSMEVAKSLTTTEQNELKGTWMAHCEFVWQSSNFFCHPMDHSSPPGSSGLWDFLLTISWNRLPFPPLKVDLLLLFQGWNLHLPACDMMLYLLVPPSSFIRKHHPSTVYVT